MDWTERMRQSVLGWVGRSAGMMIAGVAAGWVWMPAGFAAGWLVDRRLRLRPYSGMAWRQAYPDRAYRTFLVVTCATMGCVARTGGRVTEQQIQVASQVFDVLALSGEQRREAIALFRRGKRSDFPLFSLLRRARRHAGKETALLEQLLEYQVVIASANGWPGKASRQLLSRMAAVLCIPQAQLERMFGHAARLGSGAIRATAQTPYRILGVTETASEGDLRLAYRRLISRHHPDRLQANGLPDAQVREGAARIHIIKQAYEQVRRQRGA
ncbi:MAG: DnaJ domain-containing protein [Ectothiorhodospiraceae bacterium]|nr:DnaJ domain-containing protein [Ectothiorhodospiraceae bacterium]MCH8504507.1 DnaJ domain-containing protein [Ectothiorhodospiraceae bacterium]